VKGFHARPVYDIMRHFTNGKNIGLMISRQQTTGKYNHCFVHNEIVEMCYVSNKPSEGGTSFPLYLKPEKENGFVQPNLNIKIIKEIAKRIKIEFDEKQFHNYSLSDDFENLMPLNIFDYIYGVLHSPAYREKYKEFLKIDFPRIPYPENAEEYWNFVKAGSKLRKLHLMDKVEPDDSLAYFDIEGSNVVEKINYVPVAADAPVCHSSNTGKVYINTTQYFDKVPLTAWEFYIGGYQPAQKWLKDRKGKTLSYDDVIHYQKIIKVLIETNEVMDSINKFHELPSS
jgi:predicted helicase